MPLDLGSADFRSGLSQETDGCVTQPPFETLTLHKRPLSVWDSVSGAEELGFAQFQSSWDRILYRLCRKGGLFMERGASAALSYKGCGRVTSGAD